MNNERLIEFSAPSPELRRIYLGVRVSKLTLYEAAFRLLYENLAISHIELHSSQALDLYAKGTQVWTAGSPDATEQVHSIILDALSNPAIPHPNDEEYLGL
jgi:hypothetical protein